MLLSMTGYGAGQVHKNGLAVSVELRTVNNRYLKLHSRLPDGYASIESKIEEVVRKQIRRGSVQLNVDVRRSTSADDYQLNREVLNSYLQQMRELQQELNDTTEVGLASLLDLPGVVNEDRGRVETAEEDWPIVREAVEEALTNLRQMRQTEGAAMERDLSEQAADIARAAEDVSKLTPNVVKAYQTRLTDRLNKLLAEHDLQVQPADVVREVGVFAERADISEEIVRLRSHLDQFDQIMKQKEAGAGRKLEFLVQELLRETNTIGSKANDAEIAVYVVHIKTCIERIREMVQNVE